MKNLLIAIILFSINLSFAKADLKSGLLECKNIESVLERLSCFDELVKNIQPDERVLNQTTAETPPVPTQAVQTNKVNQLPKAQKQKETPTNTKPPSSDFGMELKNADESIKSSIVGEFKSWEKGMKLQLKNGQVWKVLSGRPGYKKMQNPSITISRGFLGSFNAKVEGLNASAKVKRIK
ncbi:MAG: hypothetical protein ACPGJI_03760 [Kangiellaceae bacterium]